MSLYHEAATVLTGSGSGSGSGSNIHGGPPPQPPGGSFKSRVFGNKDLKSPPAQVYALALETCKWSSVLKEVVENSGLLAAERKLTPALALLLTHDLLVSKSGVALPQSHGLRQTVERHRARLTSEFTRARLRRRCATLAELRAQIEHAYAVSSGLTIHPRWIRVNTLRTTVDEQLETTFKGWDILPSVGDLLRTTTSSSVSASSVANHPHRKICLDAHVPNLIAVSPLSGVDFTKTDAYREGKIILQDKASCFPAYLLDPDPGAEAAADVIDACSAPGNKTTHLAAILAERDRSLLLLKPSSSATPKNAAKGRGQEKEEEHNTHAHARIFAFEKDKFRAKTLTKMVGIAGSDGFTLIHPGCDFLRVDPYAEEYRHVGALLLDPSCSGSGIVGRDVVPELHLPSCYSSAPGHSGNGKKNSSNNKNKRKRDDYGDDDDKDKRDGNKKKPSTLTSSVSSSEPLEMIDDDGNSTMPTSTQDLQDRINSLASFQLSLLLHAFKFPAARRITYSTCSIYAGENEHVVVQALRSEIARQRGWRILPREEQVSGMREWDVRGSLEACEGLFLQESGDDVQQQQQRQSAKEIAEGCVRAYNVDDGRGVMGFFVAGFVRRDEDETTTTTTDVKKKKGEGNVGDGDGPFVRDEHGRIIRDENGIPTLKSTGKKAFDLDQMDDDDDDESSVEYHHQPSYIGEDDDDDGDGDGPFLRDESGRIIRDSQGMPTLKERLQKGLQKGSGSGSGSVLEKKNKKKKKKNKKNKNTTKKESGESIHAGNKDQQLGADDGGDDEWDGFED